MESASEEERSTSINGADVQAEPQASTSNVADADKGLEDSVALGNKEQSQLGNAHIIDLLQLGRRVKLASEQGDADLEGIRASGLVAGWVGILRTSK